MLVQPHASSTSDSTAANALTITVIVGSALLLFSALAGSMTGLIEPAPQAKQMLVHVAAKPMHPHRMS